MACGWRRAALDADAVLSAARVVVVLEDLGESETYAPGPEGTDGRYNIDENAFVFGGFDYSWEHEPRSSPDAVMTACAKPSFSASFRRCCAWATGLIAPERLISPK